MWKSESRAMAKTRPGPKRRKRSTVKIPCAWKGCRSLRDVKNISEKLQVNRCRVDMTMLRPTLRRDAKIIRFCCYQHRDRCIATEPQQPRGQREPLEANQLADLFNRLVAQGTPWAAVLCLLQLQCGERADCARQCRWSWFRNVGADSAATPSIAIPRINGKTKTREIPLLPMFAAQLYAWTHGQPLKTPNSDDVTWPFPKQKTHGSSLLFPGLSRKGGYGQWWKRSWSKPVSERAYLGTLKKVAQRVKQEQQQNGGTGHLWFDVEVDKIGTHSLKRSAATWPCLESPVNFRVVLGFRG